MKKMKIFFVLGSCFLSLTTFVLIVIIPTYNSKIDILTNKISIITDTIKEKESQFRDFQDAESKVVSMRNILMLFESSNLEQSKAYHKLKKELYNTRVNSLIILATAIEKAI